MSKRQWIIFSIITSFLSLIISILTYFGLIRYINMYMYHPKSYANIYKNLERAKTDTRVVISLNVKNINNIKPVINSLLDQTVRVDEISINNVDYINDIKGIVHIYKSNTCTMKSCLMRETDKNTIIISVNDDKIYGKDFIQDLIEASDKHENIAVISNNDAILTKTEFFDIDSLDSLELNDYLLKEYLTSKNIIFKNINYTENYKKI